jgi:protein-disulfide isomerase
MSAMAVRKTPLKKEPQNDYIEFKLPRIPRVNARLFLSFLVIGLVGLSFLAGYQTAKVTYWEQKEKDLGAALSGAQGAVPTPTPSFYEVGNGHLPIMGKANAKVTIVEFSDLQCLFCRQFWKDTLPQLKKDYIDKGLVKLAYRQFPLPAEIHPAARDLSEASECANDQNKFWEFHDKAFSEQAALGAGTIPVSADDITNWASQLGFDMTNFNDCFSTKKEAKKVDTDMADGQKVNVTSTPTFYINGQMLVGALPYDSFKTIIDQELKK